MSAVIELDHLTKHYGSSRGVEDITLEIEPQAIFGFLGPNGAGKSTTINMLMDLIRPTSGKISIFGLDSRAKSVEIHRRVGFLASDFALDESLTGWQALEYFGRLHENFDRKYIQELAERLECTLTRPIKTLSRGNRQKVGLISALMHKPELLVFDEPTSGLDPIIQAEFNKLMLEHKAAGGTTFLSSHLLSEVQEVCDKAAFIREGRIIAVEQIASLRARSPKRVYVATSNAALKKSLKSLKGFLESNSVSGVEGTFSGDVNELIKLLSKHKVDDVQISEADLETIFMQYYQEKAHV